MTAWWQLRREPAPDDHGVRMMRAALDDLGPDPLFRRRLRGAVLNQFVATREGLLRGATHVGGPVSRRGMGTVGRAVLVASFVLAATMASVAAASQEALPGEALYAVKRQIEELRLQIASPDMRQALAVAAFAERIEELDRLVAAGAWSQAAAAVDEVKASGAQLISIGLVISATETARISDRLAVLSALIEDAPQAAKAGLAQAIAASTQVLQSVAAPAENAGGSNSNDNSGANGSGSSTGSSGGGGNGGGAGGSVNVPGGSDGTGGSGGNGNASEPSEHPAPTDPGSDPQGPVIPGSEAGEGGAEDKTPKPKASHRNPGG